MTGQEKVNGSDPVAARPKGMELDETGLTKREYFAAIALQGLLSDSHLLGYARDFASTAVKYADALIDELNGATLTYTSLVESMKKGAGDDD
jgi:hypothetical protein